MCNSIAKDSTIKYRDPIEITRIIDLDSMHRINGIVNFGFARTAVRATHGEVKG